MTDFPERRDLRPAPGPSTSFLDPAGGIRGRHGAGFLFLFSPTFRCISGYDWRRNPDGRLEPHPHSRNLLSGRKTIAWMHHGFMPHVFWPRGDDAYDLYAVMGTWGEHTAWGDGTEAVYPGYGVARARRAHPEPPWDDGVALDLVFVDAAGGTERSFRDVEWSFHLLPGSIRFQAEDGAEVVLHAPAREDATLRVRVRPPRGTGRVRLLARMLLRKVVLPPPEHDEPVDVLDAPFGFGAFTRERLRYEPGEEETRFVSGDEGIALCWRIFGAANAAVRAAPSDLYSVERTDAADPASAGTEAEAFDVVLEADVAGGEEGGVEFLFRAVPAEAPVRRPRPSGRKAEEATARWWRDAGSLEVRTGNDSVDGLIRWSLVTASSLPWPNGAIATGALGYGGCGHVGQDVPFCYLDFLVDDHPLLQRAAERSLAHIWENPRRDDLPGVADHPCTGFDFAFQPFDPWTARVWKPEGGCGFFRQLISLHDYWAFTRDDERAERWFRIADGVYRRHYHPFRADAPEWTGGQETQAVVFTLTTAPRALRLAARMADAFGMDAASYRRDADAAVDMLNRTRPQGGLILEEDLVEPNGRIIPAGVILSPFAGHMHPSYDVPLYNAIALIDGALTATNRERIARFLANRSNGWWIEGIGLAKQNDGRGGIWFWHNAIAAGALARCADLDAAFVEAAADLMQWMGNGVADINGIGCPGEEINGGDYAMGVGCLAPIYFLRGFLGMEAGRDGLTLDPVLPRSWPRIDVRNLAWQGRRMHVRVQRGVAAPGAVAEDSEGILVFNVP